MSDADEIILKVDGERLFGWEGLTVTRRFDAAADAFAFTVPFEGGEDNARRFQPFTSRLVKVQYRYGRTGNTEDVLTGYIEKVSTASTTDGRQIKIEGRSASGQLVDNSAGPRTSKEGWSFEYEVGSLDRVMTLASIAFTPEPESGFRNLDTTEGLARLDPQFSSRLTPPTSVEPGNSVWKFLSSLAANSGFRGLPQPNGQLHFTALNPLRNPIGSITEGDGVLESIETTHDMTKRFREYVVVSDGEGGRVQASVEDTSMFENPRRVKIVETDQDAENPQAAALFARARGLLESYSCKATLQGWTFAGRVWGVGAILNVKAPSAFIRHYSQLSVREATLTYDEDSGKRTNLELVLPEAMTDRQPNPENAPWRV